MTVGEKIRLMRKEAGKTLEDLAQDLGVSKQAISEWENVPGKIPSARLAQLALYFKKPRNYFDDDKGNRFSARPGRRSTDVLIVDPLAKKIQELADKRYISFDLMVAFILSDWLSRAESVQEAGPKITTGAEGGRSPRGSKEEGLGERHKSDSVHKKFRPQA